MDLLSNMLSKIKNASMAKRDFIEVPFSNKCLGVAEVLKSGGFVSGVKTFKQEKSPLKGIRVDIKDEKGDIRITDLKIMSKPGRRLYVHNEDIKAVRGDYILSVVSTSRGMMKGSEARKKKLGGELICIVK